MATKQFQNLPHFSPQRPPGPGLSVSPPRPCQSLTGLMPSAFLSLISPVPHGRHGRAVTVQIVPLPCPHTLHGTPLILLFSCTPLRMHKAYMVSPAGILPSVLSQDLCPSCALCLEHCFHDWLLFLLNLYWLYCHLLTEASRLKSSFAIVTSVPLFP